MPTVLPRGRGVPGDVLVGKVTPKGETKATAEDACCASHLRRQPVLQRCNHCMRTFKLLKVPDLPG